MLSFSNLNAFSLIYSSTRVRFSLIIRTRLYYCYYQHHIVNSFALPFNLVSNRSTCKMVHNVGPSTEPCGTLAHDTLNIYSCFFFLYLYRLVSRLVRTRFLQSPTQRRRPQRARLRRGASHLLAADVLSQPGARLHVERS